MTDKIKLVRLYLTEGDKLLKPIMSYLHDEVHIKGVTVFRAVSGFGKSGSMHSSEILSVSFDLPIVIEFFDLVSRVDDAIEHLSQMLEPGHIVSWLAECH